MFFPMVDARSIMKEIVKDLIAIENKMRFIKDFRK